VTPDDPEDADLRREEAYELRHQRRRYRDGRYETRVPMSAWTSGAVPRAGGPDFGFAAEGVLAYVICLSEPPPQ
jgi:hypothetical protein